MLLRSRSRAVWDSWRAFTETWGEILTPVGITYINFFRLISYISADNDELPFPRRALWTHETAWRAVYQTLASRLNEQANTSRNGMDSTLIFVSRFTY